jgi:two-component system sensor histidine kinase UhpB
MARPLRVLFVDDSVFDCMLLVKELRHGGFEPRYARVDSVDGLAAELAASRGTSCSLITTCRSSGPAS